jgi:hypothetical protein
MVAYHSHWSIEILFQQEKSIFSVFHIKFFKSSLVDEYHLPQTTFVYHIWINSYAAYEFQNRLKLSNFSQKSVKNQLVPGTWKLENWNFIGKVRTSIFLTNWTSIAVFWSNEPGPSVYDATAITPNLHRELYHWKGMENQLISIKWFP